MELKSIGKRPFYIMKCGHIPEKITGYVYATERNFYGIDKRNSYEWFITDIFTGALVGDAETRKEALAKITADLDDFLARAHTMEYCRKDMETLAELNGVKPELTEKPAKNTRRAIKTRTYNNFMRVLRAVMAKGYDKETAETITRRIFDQYEANPRGLSVWGLFDLVADAETDETTTDEETPTTTETAPQKGTEDAQTETSEEAKTAPAEKPETAPQRLGKETPAQTTTDARKSPPQGAEKPTKASRKRHRDNPRSTAQTTHRATARAYTPKVGGLYRGIPPGG